MRPVQPVLVQSPPYYSTCVAKAVITPLGLLGCLFVRVFVFSCFRVFVFSCVCVCVCVCHAFRTRGRTFVLTSYCQRIEYRMFRSIPWVRIKNLSYRTNEMYHQLVRILP